MHHLPINFFTATILVWKHLLKEDTHKNIILDSLCFGVLLEKNSYFGGDDLKFEPINNKNIQQLKKK